MSVWDGTSQNTLCPLCASPENTKTGSSKGPRCQALVFSYSALELCKTCLVSLFLKGRLPWHLSAGPRNWGCRWVSGWAWLSSRSFPPQRFWSYTHASCSLLDTPQHRSARAACLLPSSVPGALHHAPAIQPSALHPWPWPSVPREAEGSVTAPLLT